MAIYLREDEIGQDPNLVGFPTLGSCMGLAVVTDNSIFGFHMPPGHADRISAFGALWQGEATHGLFACCRFAHRYSGSGDAFSQWVQEVKIYARAMSYRGPVTGVNLSTLLGGTTGRISDATESAYCEFGLSPAGIVTIGASLTSDTTATTRIDANTGIRRVSASGNQTVPYRNRVIDSVTRTSGDPMTTPAGGKSVFSFTL